MPARRAQSAAAAAAVLAACGVFLLRARYYAAWMDDDAFISFRYARNLVRGTGLVYNPGEYVEGYSNFLWTILLAGAHALGAPLPEAARGIGIAFALATGILFLLPRLRVLPRGVAGAPPAPFLLVVAAAALWLTDSWAAWAVGGLENSLGAFLVAATFLLYFRSLYAADPAPAAALAGLVGVLAALTHPSYAVFGALLGIHSIAAAIRSRSFRRPLALCAPALLVAVPYLAWKIGYYGDALPNTFRAKVGITAAVLGRGLRYLERLARGLPIVAILAPTVAGWLIARRDRDPRPWLLLAGLGLYAAYAVAIGGEEFPAFRLFVVVLPLACLLLQYATASVAATGRAGPVVALVLVVPAAAGLVVLNRLSPQVRVLDWAVEVDALGTFRAVGLELKRRLPPDGLVAYSGAGVVAFYSERPFLDTLGLTDAHIASRPVDDLGAGMAGHERGDGQYVFDRRPQVVIMTGYPGAVSSFRPVFRGDRELLAIPDFLKVYEPRIMMVRLTPRGATKEMSVRVPLFVRRDSTMRRDP